MRKVIIIFALFLVISFCSAMPQISFQHDSYLSQETVLGSISESLTTLTKDSLKIFDGRKEVFFDRDVLSYNGNYYFYIIFPRGGLFNISFGNILYNQSGNIDSVNLQAQINVSDDINQSRIMVNPGFYYGSNPEISASNPGTNSVEFVYNGQKTILNPTEFKKLKINATTKFSYAKIESYKNFLIPILYINFSETSNSPNNVSVVDNSSNDDVKINLSVQKNLTINAVANQTVAKFILVENFGDEINLTLKSNIDNVQFNKDIFLSENESSEIKITLLPSAIGASIGQIEFYHGSEKIASVDLQIFVFEDNKSVENFIVRMSENTITNCDSGFLCESGENCNSNSFSIVSGKICCSTSCTNPDSGGSGFLQILIGLVLVGLVGFVGYHFYSKYKKIGPAKAEDKFKEFDKKYQKNILGKN